MAKELFFLCRQYNGKFERLGVQCRLKANEPLIL